MADAIVTTNLTGQQQQQHQKQQQQQQQAQTNSQSNKKKSKNKKKNSTINNNNNIHNNNASSHGGVENINKLNGIEPLNNGKATTTLRETMLTNGEIVKLLDQLNISDQTINGHGHCQNGQLIGAVETGIGIEVEAEEEEEAAVNAPAATVVVVGAETIGHSKAKSKQRRDAQQQKDKHCHATTTTATTTTTKRTNLGEQVQNEQHLAASTTTTTLSNGHDEVATTTDDFIMSNMHVPLQITQLATTSTTTTPSTTIDTTTNNASNSSQSSTGALPKTKPSSKSTAKKKQQQQAVNNEEPTTSINRIGDINVAEAVVAAAAGAGAGEAVDAKIETTTATATISSSSSSKTADDVDVNETVTETLPPATPDIEIEYTEYESEHQMHDIMRLIQAELSEPYSIYTYRYFIYNWPKLCFLARHGNDYVGAIVCKLDMHMNVRRGYIAMLAVRKEYRKLKIGTTLVQKAIEAMLADNADEVVLETEMRNVPALRLYENLGFVRDKRLFRYYLNGVDALRLKLWFR